MDNEFLLIDRLDVIKQIILNNEEKKFVISFSGGKDSTVLHYLVDMALPNNKIPRVFIDTGVEYIKIREFVNSLAKKDDRFVIIRPERGLGVVVRKHGYPFKSKEHSQIVHDYQHSDKLTDTTIRYIRPLDKQQLQQGEIVLDEKRKRYMCPKKLLYQFSEDNHLPISKACCDELKKKPFLKWQEENNKPIKLTGERIAEGGLRASHGDCLVIDKNTKQLKKFKPLNPMKDDWLDWFINKYNIKLCDLYYPPYNFKRTGCVGCPYNTKIQKDLEQMYLLDMKEYKQCKGMWKQVYDEYIRLKYRLKYYPDEKEKGDTK